MVERPIHNLKVAGSNPEVGNIFSEKYWKGGARRESMMVALEKRERYGSMKLLFLFYK